MAANNASQNFASLYVGDLHPDVTEAILYEIFNSVGPVGSIRVCRDSVSRRSLGYGYINFHNVADAERALDTLNYSSIKGRACRIMWSQRDPSLRKSGQGNIFVKNLDVSIDNKALYDTFSLFGNILSCKVACEPSGKSLGYGFVHYETEDAAKTAIEKVNNMQIGEQTVEVHPFKKRDSREQVTTFTNLFCKNLPTDFNQETLDKMFSEHGEVTSSVVREDDQGRKFCFVNYAAPESAQKAIEALNGKDLRTEEQKASADASADPESFLTYVGRAMNKKERIQEWKTKNAQPVPTGQAAGLNLYVKNLDENTTDEMLREFFSPFGTITSCLAMKDDKGKCKGFGFVCYSTPSEATKAVTEMHLKVMQGKPLYVGLAERKEARQERLRARYSPNSPPTGGKGKDGGGKGKGQQNQGAQSGPGMMGPMGGPGMNQPGMMGMMPKGGLCGGMPPMMGGKGGVPPAGKGPMNMLNQPMMNMMGKGGPNMLPPQMMNMFGAKGQMGAMGGCMRPMMPMMPGQRGPMPAQQMQRPGMPPQNATVPISAVTLAGAGPPQQKQLLGERLFPAVQRFQPELAGKITGMMLEMENSELLLVLDNEAKLKEKVEEAMNVLETNRNN